MSFCPTVSLHIVCVVPPVPTGVHHPAPVVPTEVPVVPTEVSVARPEQGDHLDLQTTAIYIIWPGNRRPKVWQQTNSHTIGKGNTRNEVRIGGETKGGVDTKREA